MKKIIRFLDKLEDRVRGFLSHKPIFYGFVAGVGMVFFWRGVWHMIDTISGNIVDPGGESFATADLLVWDGLISIGIGSAMLLISGSFVSTFIGNEIIISGLRGEKKLVEKTEAEVKTETGAIARVEEKLEIISSRLEKLEKRNT